MGVGDEEAVDHVPDFWGKVYEVEGAFLVGKVDLRDCFFGFDVFWTLLVVGIVQGGVGVGWYRFGKVDNFCSLRHVRLIRNANRMVDRVECGRVSGLQHLMM